MPNYGVQHARPALSLLKLRDELNQVFPGRFTGTDGFITGYGQGQKTGHNPNHLGHTMAFDISTPANGQHITEAEGRALSEYLRAQANVKFRYLIHDMSAGAPLPQIAGDFSAWAWTGYVGDPHSNHIHISLTDDYLWGDDCGLAQSIYDDQSSWGVVEFFQNKPIQIAKPNVPVPAPVSPAPVQSGTFLAFVETGDTLTSIAAQFNTSVDAIIKVNPGINANVIFPNQKLNIPGTLPGATPTTSGKTINQLADEVIAGHHGSGAQREASLGGLNAQVQAEVNRRLLGTPAPAAPPAKTIGQWADEVIAGHHGSGADRQARLGALYDQVQNEVNRKLGAQAAPAPSGPSIAQLADATIRGEYGDGDARVQNLGANYNAVQAEINRRYGM